MIEFYNAFISYRHAPADTAVAAQIQRRLESYRIPRTLKGKVKHDRIDRIFRDREELPATSDLSEDISRALKAAEYLIVICSTSTKESTWVTREIEQFLETHNREHILTVLVDGDDPREVIPEELLREERAVANSSVAGDAATSTIPSAFVPVEPLSADYRGAAQSKRTMLKANREELPRLAAALLGCSYDELVRRERQRTLHRRTAILGTATCAALALAGYTAWSQSQIADSYQAILTQQSRTLAVESQNLLEEGDPIAATQVALAALPDTASGKSDSRPVVPQAQQALTQAIGAYRTPQAGFTGVSWTFDMEGAIEDFCVNADKTLLAAYDSTNTLQVWDLSTLACVYQKQWQLDDPLQAIAWGDDKHLLVQTAGALCVIDTTTEDVVWSAQGSFRNRIAICEATGQAAIVATDAASGDRTVSVLNIGNGSVAFEETIPTLEESTSYTVTFSPDGAWLSVYAAPGLTDSSSYGAIAKFNLIDHNFEVIDTNCYEITSCVISNGGSLYVLGFEDEQTASASSVSLNAIDGSPVYLASGKGRQVASAIDAQGSTAWTRHVSYEQIPSPSNSMLFTTTYTDTDGATHDALGVVAGELIEVLDEDTGTAYLSRHMPSCIVKDGVLLDSNTGDNGAFNVVCEDGHLDTIDHDSTDDLQISSLYVNNLVSFCDITNAQTGIPHFLVQQRESSAISLLADGRDWYDTDYRDFSQQENLTASTYARDFAQVSNYAVVLSDESPSLLVYDIEHQTLQTSIDLQELGAASSGDISFLESAAQGGSVAQNGSAEQDESSAQGGSTEHASQNDVLFLYNRAQNKLQLLDPAQETIADVALPEGISELLAMSDYTLGEDWAVQNGVLFLKTKARDANTLAAADMASATDSLMRVDLASSTWQAVSLSVLADSSGYSMSTGIVPSPDGTKALVLLAQGAAPGGIVDFSASSVTALPMTSAESSPTSSALSVAAWTSDGSRVAVASDGSLDLYASTGERVAHTATQVKGYSPNFVGFAGDAVLFAWSDGTLNRYATDDLSLQGTLEIADSFSTYGLASAFASSRASGSAIEKDGLLFLRIGGGVTVIDESSWCALAQIDSCLAYVPERDIFLVEHIGQDEQAIQTTQGSWRLGWFPRYSTDDLIEKGHTFLRGRQLSEARKLTLGIA